MEIRGIGDTQGTRRLLWLFGTTIIAPALLLGLMALGALGHSQWNAGEVAARELQVQLPLVAEVLHLKTLDLERQVDALRMSCPELSCPPPEGVASWSATGWQPDLKAFGAWATHRLRGGGPVAFQATISARASQGSVPLEGKLAGMHLVPSPPPGSLLQTREPLEAVLALFLLVTVVAGAAAGLRSAAREIRMSRRQTDMISRVSHELRTPMTSIRMFVDTLREGRMDPARSEECLDLLASESSRLSRRIEEVLLWAGMEAGARRYAREDVTAPELAEEAVRAFRSQFLLEDDVAHIEVTVPDDLPPLRVDRDAVVEALLNLLVNAFRHCTDPRHIVLSAALQGRRVGLSVTDNGPGIRRSDRRRIFEKFYRPDDDQQDDDLNKGTGLGLAIVRAVVRAHGGRVQLESTLHQGSTFTLWLPAA